MTDGNLHHRTRNLTGQTFGALTVVGAEHSDGKKRYWKFQCQCGEYCVKTSVTVTKEVKRGGIPNCGCMTRALIGEKNTTHGMSKHPAFAVWRSMNDRCRLPTHQAWRNYGARGITVCERWQQSFENFWADMGPTYEHGLELDRKDNNGSYSLENCHWATRRENVMNRRNTVRGVDVMKLSQETGIYHGTIYNRLRSGWSIDQLTRKPDVRNRSTTSSTLDPDSGS